MTLELKPTDFNLSIVTTNNIATIGAGQTVSTIVETIGLPLLSIQFPSNFTTSNVTFSCSLDGTNFYQLKDVDNLVPTVTSAAASDFRYITTTWLAGARFFKLVTSAAQVNQVDILLGLRRVS